MARKVEVGVAASFFAVALLCAVFAADAAAQVVDSSRAADVQQRDARRDSLARLDSLARSPLSPGRAFLGSFLLPGLSQSTLRRPTAMVIFVTVEASGWFMLQRSLADLSRAKRFARDSVVAEYRIDPTTGLVLRDPDTQEPIPLTFEPDVFREGLISARRQHVEDWAAIILFNHLMAGVDALVAAHLWDVPLRVGIRATPTGGALQGTIRW